MGNDSARGATRKNARRTGGTARKAREAGRKVLAVDNFDRDVMYEMAKHIFDRSFRPELFSDFCDQPIWAFDSVAGLKFLTAQVVRLVRL